MKKTDNKKRIPEKKAATGKVSAKQSWKPGNMLYPLPAVMVSCALPGEKPNIITLAWAGTVCSDPAMVSISVRPSRFSYDIIKKSGEFVINLVTEDLLKACDWCGVKSGRDHDKFKEQGLTPFVSEYIKTPGILESPVNIYCKVKEAVALGSHDMFIGEVKGITVDEALMNDTGRFELNAAKLIAYSHGEYFALGKKLGTFGYSVKKRP
ncbi:MAG: flavin reductase family protein [Lachnospiraceae bacterium]|nr:flavin reductase family protein [Lachnospiraceae bacterium]